MRTGSNHHSAYYRYTDEHGIGGVIFTFISLFVKVGVPLFFMISGTLLLRKDEKYSVTLKKRVLRIAIGLLLFSALSYCFDELIRNMYGVSTTLSIGDFFYKFISGTIGAHYWFLYAYIGILLILPILRAIAQKMTKTECTILVVLRLLFAGVIPCLNLLLSMNGADVIKMEPTITSIINISMPVFYVLIGYYIDNNVNISKINLKKKLLAVLATIVGMSIACACTIAQRKFTGHATQDFMMSFELLPTILIFIACKQLFSNRINLGDKIKSVIIYLSGLTFGISWIISRNH